MISDFACDVSHFRLHGVRASCWIKLNSYEVSDFILKYGSFMITSNLFDCVQSVFHLSHETWCTQVFIYPEGTTLQINNDNGASYYPFWNHISTTLVCVVAYKCINQYLSWDLMPKSDVTGLYIGHVHLPKEMNGETDVLLYLALSLPTLRMLARISAHARNSTSIVRIFFGSWHSFFWWFLFLIYWLYTHVVWFNIINDATYFSRF